MANINQSMAELKTLVGQAETELKSLHEGRKASAPRVRASLQKIKTLSHAMRAGVMEHVKSLPTVTRVKKGKENVEPVEDAIPPPPVLQRESTEVPVPVKPKPAKKSGKSKSVKILIGEKIDTTL